MDIKLIKIKMENQIIHLALWLSSLIWSFLEFGATFFFIMQKISLCIAANIKSVLLINEV